MPFVPPPLPLATPDLGAVKLGFGGVLVLPGWRDDIGIVPLAATIAIPDLDVFADTALPVPLTHIDGAAATVLFTGEVQYQLPRAYCTTEGTYSAEWTITIPVPGAANPAQATRTLTVETQFVITDQAPYLDINRFWKDPVCLVPTPAYLRAKTLKGIPLVDRNKSTYGDEAIQAAIDMAVQSVESRLDYTICPRVFTSIPVAEIANIEGGPPVLPAGLPIVGEDAYDYDPQKFRSAFSFLRFKHHPVTQLFAIEMRVGNQVVVTIPPKWFVLYQRAGDLQLVPDALTSLALSVGGIAYPLLRNSFGSNVIPSLWHALYSAGKGADAALFEIIAMTAAVNVLENVSAQRPNVSSESVSLDGLSQSQSFPVSAQAVLFGPQIATLQAQIDAWYQNNEDVYRNVIVGLI